MLKTTVRAFKMSHRGDALFPEKFSVAYAQEYPEKKLKGKIIKELGYRLSTICLTDSGPRRNCRLFYSVQNSARDWG